MPTCVVSILPVVRLSGPQSRFPYSRSPAPLRGAGEAREAGDSGRLRLLPLQCSRSLSFLTVVSAPCPQASETPTLHGLSFTVRPGELLAVVGPVGAGKVSEWLLPALVPFPGGLCLSPRGRCLVPGTRGQHQRALS